MAEDFERPFRRLDHEALLLQNRFWRQQVALIAGGLLATALGAYQLEPSNWPECFLIKLF